MDAAQKAKSLGCTVEQLKAQYARNAEDLRVMLGKANSTGKKVNGYTAAQLAERVAKLEGLAK